MDRAYRVQIGRTKHLHVQMPLAGSLLIGQDGINTDITYSVFPLAHDLEP
jgi:hypothetical protein